MNELLEVLDNCCKCFYIGKDDKAWLYFSNVIEIMQNQLSNADIDEKSKSTILEFISNYEEIERLKASNNYTMIADTLYNFEKELMCSKEFS